MATMSHLLPFLKKSLSSSLLRAAMALAMPCLLGCDTSSFVKNKKENEQVIKNDRSQ